MYTISLTIEISEVNGTPLIIEVELESHNERDTSWVAHQIMTCVERMRIPSSDKGVIGDVPIIQKTKEEITKAITNSGRAKITGRIMEGIAEAAIDSKNDNNVR